MRARYLFSVLLVVLLGTLASADYAMGREAYNRGNYAAALHEWTPLALDFHFDLIIRDWPANSFSLWTHIHGPHLNADKAFTNPIQRFRGHGYRIGGLRL